MPVCRNFRKHGFCAEHDIGVCPLRHELDPNDRNNRQTAALDNEGNDEVSVETSFETGGKDPDELNREVFSTLFKAGA